MLTFYSVFVNIKIAFLHSSREKASHVLTLPNEFLPERKLLYPSHSAMYALVLAYARYFVLGFFYKKSDTAILGAILLLIMYLKPVMKFIIK